MEIPKTGQTTESPKSSEPANIGPRNPVPGKEPQPVEILELSIEEDIDVGVDPYNNTGDQVILRLRKDRER